jgi:large subunit ribosomal protein L35
MRKKKKKTNKAILKRFKIKKDNKIYRKKAFKNHLLCHKNKNRLRRLTQVLNISIKFIPKFNLN